MLKLSFLRSGFLILNLILELSCQTTPATVVRDSAAIKNYGKTGRHFIISVHGIRSKSTDFGDAQAVLISHLKKLRPDIEYKFLAFDYPSGSNQDIFRYAYKNLNEFLIENIQNPSRNDSLIFLTHSQGGLMATAWKAAVTYNYFKQSFENDRYLQSLQSSKIYGDITDHIIMVGTPYWGSNIAKFAFDNGVLKSGYDNELKDMIFNSDTILWFRELAEWVSDSAQKVDRPEDNTLYTVIAGIMPDMKSKLFYKNEAGRNRSNFVDSLELDILNGFAKRYSFSSEKINSKKPDRFESDLAVTVPSTRSDFYFASKDVTCNDHEIKSEEFVRKNLYPRSRYVLTESMHSKLPTDARDRTKGMVRITKSCLEAAQCDHPTYRYILKTIAACETEQCDPHRVENILNALDKVKYQENKYDRVLTSGIDLQGFSLDFNVRVPMDYDIPEQYYRGNTSQDDREIKSQKLLNSIIQLNKKLLKDDFYNTLEVKVLRRREANSAHVCWGDRTKCEKGMTDLRFHITGFIKPKSLQILSQYQQGLLVRGEAGLVLPFEIMLPPSKNYSPQKVTVYAQVKPGHSTYVKLNFDKALSCNLN